MPEDCQCYGLGMQVSLLTFSRIIYFSSWNCLLSNHHSIYGFILLFHSCYFMLSSCLILTLFLSFFASFPRYHTRMHTHSQSLLQSFPPSFLPSNSFSYTLSLPPFFNPFSPFFPSSIPLLPPSLHQSLLSTSLLPSHYIWHPLLTFSFTSIHNRCSCPFH